MSKNKLRTEALRRLETTIGRVKNASGSKIAAAALALFLLGGAALGVSAASGGPDLTAGVRSALSDSDSFISDSEVLGLVTSVDCDAGTLSIDGLTILLSDSTEWEDGLTCEDISIGMLIEVHTIDEDGTLVAGEVELEDADHDDADEADEHKGLCADLAEPAAAEACHDAVAGAAEACVGIANEADLDRCEDAIDDAEEACDDLDDEAAEDACENELDLLEDAAEDALDALEDACDLLEGQEHEDCEDALDGDDEGDEDNSGPSDAHDADEDDSDDSRPGNANDEDDHGDNSGPGDARDADEDDDHDGDGEGDHDSDDDDDGDHEEDEDEHHHDDDDEEDDD